MPDARPSSSLLATAGFLRRYARAKLSVFLGIPCDDDPKYMCALTAKSVMVVR
jgi:hypothetical protein